MTSPASSKNSRRSACCPARNPIKTEQYMAAPIFKSVNALLEDLGITEPEELDLAVIAQHCRATVLYKPLEGCAARISGTEERAIITVDNSNNTRIERQRFSIGHELGHWMWDRGQMSLLSCEEGVFVRE